MPRGGRGGESVEVSVSWADSGRMVAKTDHAEIELRSEREAGGGAHVRSTDLLLMALGSCMLGTISTYAQRKGIAVRRMEALLEHDEVQGPERVGAVRLKLLIDGEVSPKEAVILRRVANTCKIHSTLHHGAQVEIGFEWTADPREAALPAAGI